MTKTPRLERKRTRITSCKRVWLQISPTSQLNYLASIESLESLHFVLIIIFLAIAEELNEEDQNLKNELDMLVERLKVCGHHA